MGEPKERRPKIPHKVQLDIAFRDHGLCCLCFNVILGDEPRILEHKVPRAMFKNRADADKPENLGWAHKPCADLKTRGCEGESNKGSVADGDLHKLAKAKRMETKRLTLGADIVMHKPLPAKIWLKPKLQSRGFDRTKTKGFDGKVKARKPRLNR